MNLLQKNLSQIYKKAHYSLNVFGNEIIDLRNDKDLSNAGFFIYIYYELSIVIFLIF